MYGFIYITTNHVNGKKYIGQKKYDKNGKWKKYLGSGIALKNAIIKYGIENFSKEIIEECETKELLDEREIYWITFYNASKDDLFYNIASGGDGGNVVLGYTEEEYIAFQNKRLKAVNLGRKQGEESGVSKLTEKQVLDIIERLKNNDFHPDIARDYNVSTCTIDDIRCHKTWKYLTKDIVFDDVSTRTRKIGKSVDVYDLNGFFIGVYKNARDVNEKLGIPFRNVSQVCNGQKRQSHGYICRFHDEPFDKYSTVRKNGKISAVR